MPSSGTDRGLGMGGEEEEEEVWVPEDEATRAQSKIPLAPPLSGLPLCRTAQ